MGFIVGNKNIHYIGILQGLYLIGTSEGTQLYVLGTPTHVLNVSIGIILATSTLVQRKCSQQEVWLT